MIERKFQVIPGKPEKAFIVAVETQKQSPVTTAEYLDELSFLASTAGVEEVGRIVQKLPRPDLKTYIGKGKLEDLLAGCEALGADMVIFDDDLSPSQVRNLENTLKIKVLDRSLLILEIFSMRAQSAQSRTQVELAQYQYLYPRLTRMWSHLSKQKGGIGMRGPGEKELETDRRIVQDRISFLKEKLKVIDRQSVTRRSGREQLVRVALVGYTNVGKSTLMNVLSKSQVLAENKLFATVDSTVRKINLNNLPFLLTDTVGFIRKLPTHLVEAFKSTLDEVREADILLHVVDVSAENFEHQMQIVNDTLASIKADDKPIITVYNKVDLYKEKMAKRTQEPEPKPADYLDKWLENSDLPEITEPTQEPEYLTLKGGRDSVYISATERDGLQELRDKIFDRVLEKHLVIFPNWLKDLPTKG